MSCNDPIQNCLPCADCPPAPTPLPPCTDGEPCEDIQAADCVRYVGPTLPAINVTNGDRLSKMLIQINKAVNALLPTPVDLVSYILTNTATTGNFVVTYLGVDNGADKIFTVTLAPAGTQTVQAYRDSAVILQGTGTID